MSEIDFQNGFLCGMATRGMATNGFSYRRFIEVNAFDGILFGSISLSDSATSSFDALNDSDISDSITFSTISFTDESEVTLI